MATIHKGQRGGGFGAGKQFQTEQNTHFQRGDLDRKKSALSCASWPRNVDEVTLNRSDSVLLQNQIRVEFQDDKISSKVNEVFRNAD